MSFKRNAILNALDQVDQDEFVLSVLLMMRDRRFLTALRAFCDAPPDVQTMVLSIEGEQSNEKPRSNDNGSSV